MGNYRASIYIKFRAAGKKFEQDFWINYVPDECGVDRRIIEWLDEVWQECKRKYDQDIEEYWEEIRKKEEEQEKKELKRLKEKYENSV